MKETMTSCLNQDIIDNAFIICILIAGYVLFSLWSRKKGLESLTAWAEQKGLIVVSARRSFFLPNTQWSSGKYQPFFRLALRDKEGITREGWLRCSKLGLTEPQKVDVAWDDEHKK
jgi:hypothetical protein